MWMSHPSLPGVVKTVSDASFYGGWDTLGWVVDVAPVGPPQPDAGWPVSEGEVVTLVGDAVATQLPVAITPMIEAERTSERAQQSATFVTVPPATDAVLYVAPSGLDTNNGLSVGKAFRTLTAAVAALPVGLTTPATIRLAPGAYAEPTSINLGQRQNLTIIGAGMGVTNLTFTGTGSSIVSAWPVNAASVQVNLTLRDFSLTNSNVANVGAGIEQRVGSLVYIHALGISGHKYGIIFDQTQHGHIDACNLQQQITAGIWLTHGPDWTALASLTPPFTNNITITRNQINEPATTVGIINDGGWTHSITDNSLNGCSNQIVIAGLSGGSITGNECENGSAHYIVVTNVSKLLASAVGGCAGLLIAHNTIDTNSTGVAAINLVGATEAIVIESNSMSSTGFAIRGGSTVTTLVSLGNINNGVGAQMHETKATNHMSLDKAELALLGPAFKTTIKYSPPASGTTVFLDMGNGVKDTGGVVPAFGIGRGDPSAIGSLDLRGGSDDTHRIRALINGVAALQLISNGAGSQMLLSDARDIVLGTTTGTKIGTAVGQKIGFWGVTPVTQRNAYAVSNPTALKALDGAATSANTLAEVIQVLGRLITDLKTIGVLGS